MSALTVAIFAAGWVLVRWQPKTAATLAVIGLLFFGLLGIWWGLQWIVTGGHGYRTVGMPSFYGAVYGAVLVDGGTSELLAGAAGRRRCSLVGALLAPRLLRWDADSALAARAQALTQRVDRLTETRSDATETAVAELRRIERDLHDGAQARLVAVGMSLRAAEELMRANPEAARRPGRRGARDVLPRPGRPPRPGPRHLPAGARRPGPRRRGPRPGPGRPDDRGHGHYPPGGTAHAGRGGGLLRASRKP